MSPTAAVPAQDLAYETLTTPSYPGYKWMMHNSIDNATTIWEAWFFSSNTVHSITFSCIHRAG